MLPILDLPLVIDIALYYCLYRTFKWLLSPYIFPRFRHIPGPTSQSWFKGKQTYRLQLLQGCLPQVIKGNLGQLFNAKGLPFHQQLVDRFGGMVKVYGFFGVGFSRLASFRDHRFSVFIASHGRQTMPEPDFQPFCRTNNYMCPTPTHYKALL